MKMPEATPEQLAELISSTPTQFAYSKWRHGGWYVSNVVYPSGAVGCVSRNYPDRKWRVVCDPRGENAPTYKDRDEAAAAEYVMAGVKRLEAQNQQVLA